MKSVRSILLRTASVTAIAALLSAGIALAQEKGVGNANGSGVIPTLDGFGLAALAGALSVGGAWLLSRRDKEK